ncbi:MAG: hypothetical protein KOO65_05185 [Desulfobacterales bacterium]|nr:hypothetical protein [Desulfobacterales bacterium]
MNSDIVIDKADLYREPASYRSSEIFDSLTDKALELLLPVISETPEKEICFEFIQTRNMLRSSRRCSK